VSDHVGRKKMFYASCRFAIGFAVPLFWLLNTRDPLTITLTIIAAIVFGQLIGFGVGARWYSELFAARLRYSCASLGFQIGAAISGGFTPLAQRPSLPGPAERPGQSRFTLLCWVSSRWLP
jgi:MFS transporter, MHS family, shikimate and dehydroshikimate transport protein